MRFLLAVVVGLTVLVGGADGQAPAAPVAGVPVVCHAEWQINSYCLAIPTGDNVEASFRKEPAYTGKVERGAIPVGDKDFVGYAWDIAGRKLYIDANQDLDLTNDPSFDAGRDSKGSQQLFRPVVLTLGTAPHERVYLVDMNFEPNRKWFYVKSGWRGTFEAGGKKWVLWLDDDLSGKGAEFFVQPCDAPYHHLTERLPVGIPRQLVLDDTVYEVRPVFNEGGLDITLQPVSVPMGEVILEGQPLCLVLVGPAMLLRLAPRGANQVTPSAGPVPRTTLRVPAGDYDVHVFAGTLEQPLMAEGMAPTIKVAARDADDDQGGGASPA